MRDQLPDDGGSTGWQFMMGSSQREKDGFFYDEGPQHEVTIAKPFAVGQTEMTFAEWDACATAGACAKTSDSTWGRGERPAINVSWDDAKEYIVWLSRMTGKEYRLLTEAEWEYAARAGAASAYSWGDEIGENNANCNGCSSQWDNMRTAPVGSFKPNAFGLYDMHGNVFEWVEDTWHYSYKEVEDIFGVFYDISRPGRPKSESRLPEHPPQDAPVDGSAWLEGGDASRRVVRGGSWSAIPGFLRAAFRISGNTVDRYNYIGFRVARTLTP
jgi:formylglycine-generating enzyme required for sulfatase activity